MSDAIWPWLPGIIVTVAYLAATWDERNRWKVWCLAIVLTIGVVVARIQSYQSGYDDGVKDLSEAIKIEIESRQAQTCTEDMDCWDCETMGNRVCGPTGEPA